MFKLFENISKQIETMKAYKRTVRELQSLSDAELNDIGVNRSDIEWVARRAINSE